MASNRYIFEVFNSMMTDANFKRLYRTLNRDGLADYWNGYFEFRDSPLHAITAMELQNEIEEHKTGAGSFIDSQIVISNILGKLSNKHNFHRQFGERFPGLNREQVLGMQLYTLMLADDEIWVYIETQHQGHLFPHATYFIPRDNPDYQRLYTLVEDWKDSIQ